MPSSPSLLMGLLVSLSVVLGVVLFVLAWIVVQLRRRPIATLVRTLEEIRKRLEVLEETMGRVENSRSADSATRTHPGPPPRRSASSPLRVDAAEPNAVSGPTLITIPSLAATPSPTTSAVTNDLGRRFGPIWDLADTGASPDVIARTTGQPIGQVELILALRRQLASKAHGREPHLA